MDALSVEFFEPTVNASFNPLTILSFDSPPPNMELAELSTLLMFTCADAFATRPMIRNSAILKEFFIINEGVSGVKFTSTRTRLQILCQFIQDLCIFAL